jgi:hypothetical protein
LPGCFPVQTCDCRLIYVLQYLHSECDETLGRERSTDDHFVSCQVSVLFNLVSFLNQKPYAVSSLKTTIFSSGDPDPQCRLHDSRTRPASDHPTWIGCWRRPCLARRTVRSGDSCYHLVVSFVSLLLRRIWILELPSLKRN